MMKKWHVISAATATLLLAGCGSALDSDEYKALATESATTQHNLDQVQADLDAALADRRKLQARNDKLQEFMDDTRATNLVDAETWRARKAAMKVRENKVEAREKAVDARVVALTAEKAALAMEEFGATGTFAVGTDMSAGNYFAPGGPACKWAYLTGTSPKAKVVMARSGVDVQYLVLAAGDVFRTKGCGPWTQ